MGHIGQKIGFCPGGFFGCIFGLCQYPFRFFTDGDLFHNAVNGDYPAVVIQDGMFGNEYNSFAAIRMYEKSGYSRFDVWERYYIGGEDGVVMRKVRV